MIVRSFVDTNILLYAHDAGAAEKGIRSRELLRELLLADAGVLSPQVLMEFYVNATRKLKPALRKDAAIEVVLTYAPWVRWPTDGDLVGSALDLSVRFNVSPWDALIIAAALQAQCEYLYSEDLHDGLRIQGLEIRNPFLRKNS